MENETDKCGKNTPHEVKIRDETVMSDTERLDLRYKISNYRELYNVLPEFTNLKYLDISTSDTGLWCFPDCEILSGLPDTLEVLIFEFVEDKWPGSQKVDNLDELSGLKNLKELHLCGTTVHNIDALSNLTKLQVLDLNSTSVTGISPLAGLTELRKLDLSGNKVNDIGALSNLKNLTELSLAGSKINNFDVLSCLTSMETLNLNSTGIKDIRPLSELTGLKKLYLSGNRIECIDSLSRLTNLTKLSLENNSITDIRALSGLTNLTKLHLHYNSITDISALSGLTNLTDLFLKSNSITDISALSGLTKLENLWLEYNSIRDISALSGLTNLIILNIDRNSITDRSILSKLKKLDYFSCEDPCGYDYNFRGIKLYNIGKLDEAITVFNKAVELSGDPRYYKNRAKALTKAGRYKEAVEDYTHVINSIGEYDTECYEQRGMLNMELGRYNAAMADYAEAIRENPAEPTSYCNYGKMLYDLGRFDEAIVCFTKAIEFASDSDIDLIVLNLKNRGNACRELGQFEKAYADYARGFEITPEDPHLYFLRGFAKAAEGDFEAACADTLKAIQLKPDDADYYDALGNVFRKFERYEDAVTYYTVAIDMNSDDADYYKNRAEAYTALGKIKEAKSDNAKAAKLEKANRHADSDDTDFDATAEFEKPGRLMSYEEIAGEIFRRIKLKTLRKTVKIELKKQETTLTNSKFGGVPFIPAGGEYPKNPETGEAMHFILQINFAEMPPLPDFPAEGILQLFIADGDDLWERAEEEYEEDEEFSCHGIPENKWRMLYYEDISSPMPRKKVKALMPAAPICRVYTPIFREYGKEYLIEFEAQEMPITYNDFRCRGMIVKYGADMIPDYKKLKKYDSHLWSSACVDVMMDSLDNSDNRVGGYPSNNLRDPRGQRRVPENYEILLQIEEALDQNGKYIFSMSGPAAFFIDPEDLKKRDFSKVCFYFDFD